MIRLTRLNGERFALHVFKIEHIQSYPDTTITLTNGKKIVVKECEDEVIEHIHAFYNMIGIHGEEIEEGDRSNE